MARKHKIQYEDITIEEEVFDIAMSDGVIEPEGPMEYNLTLEQQDTFTKFKTLSSQIRYLDQLQWPRAVIARHIGKRYQHVKNVLDTELKRGPRV